MMTTEVERTHFIKQVVESDLASGKHQTIVTRFPPEPNGYLHIGHAKSICLNFGLAATYQGRCFLRFDDTNPVKEEEEYVQAIIEDVTWLGYQWCELTYASDYYQTFYESACHLIEQGLAYVDELSVEEIRQTRGSLLTSGTESPDRHRPIQENLDLFHRMKAGDFPDGKYVLRAKIDMAAGNVNLRDPVLYRIRHVSHQRTGDQWCIYPMYDYAHPLSDALENITHSLCTLEFQDHRPLYDWFIEHLPLPAKPRQIEFSRLNLSHTVTSKRQLRQLIEDHLVTGWDDPRLPTLRGMRKRGYPPEAIRLFCERIGLSKSDSVIAMSLLEDCVREVLNLQARRALCVAKPLKIVIENYPDGQEESLQVPWVAQDSASPKRVLPFSKELYIEQDDFMLTPVKGYFRLMPGGEVRLRHAYVIRCERVIQDEQGQILELRCSYDKATLGQHPVGRKVKGVIHWVAAKTAHPVHLIEYDRLFVDEYPARVEDFLQFLNPHSIQEHQGYCEPAIAQSEAGSVYQFERLGYYVVSSMQAARAKTFHQVVSLKDSWRKG